jgi:hypothetical protein
MSTRRKEPPSARQVSAAEFAAYSRAVLRELSRSATKLEEERFAILLDAAAEEADRIEKAERLKEN